MFILLYFLTAIMGCLIIGWLTRFSFRYVVSLIKNGKVSLRPAFRGFKEKIWMTLGLGMVFFGFYFAIVLISSKMITPEVGLDFFQLIYAHPKDFIYIGLSIFATLTVAIYLIRMLIKYLYITNTRG